ncbi:MAG: hypothetical protein HY718_07805 [Planctomycetes bacterium]|nr:hypothetical protein [Planctomycetota bacterium]
MWTKRSVRALVGIVAFACLLGANCQAPPPAGTADTDDDGVGSVVSVRSAAAGSARLMGLTNPLFRVVGSQAVACRR